MCRILGRGMSKDPAQRYQTAKELMAALDAVLAAPQESLTFQAPWQQLSSPFGIVPSLVPMTTKTGGEEYRDRGSVWKNCDFPCQRSDHAAHRFIDRRS